MPAPRPVRRSLITGLAALLAAASLLALDPTTAAAVVTPLHGFRATVDGFTSWYGSYGMGPLGTTWCIDHGIRAPDPAFRYVAADLSAVAPDTQAAVAWVIGAHGQGTDRVGHAAVMLVLHDLMGARYPSGRLDVGQLTPRRLAGFGGLETQVLERARILKADGLAHRQLRGPLRLTVTVAPLRDAATTITVTLRDAGHRPLPGINVRIDAPNGGARAIQGTTAANGTWRTSARPLVLPLSVRASATVPHLVLDAWAPTTQRAQRVARPAVDRLVATTTLAGMPPTTTTVATTTSTTVPPTTTTLPPTTSTLPPSTTTLPTTLPVPSTTIPAAAVPSSTSTTTIVPPPAPTLPATVLGGPPPSPSLPRTGTDVVALVLAALGLVLLGSAALDTARGRARGRAAIGHHGPHGGVGRR